MHPTNFFLATSRTTLSPMPTSSSLGGLPSRAAVSSHVVNVPASSVAKPSLLFTLALVPLLLLSTANVVMNAWTAAQMRTQPLVTFTNVPVPSPSPPPQGSPVYTDGFVGGVRKVTHGPLNSIADVPGVVVGVAQSTEYLTGAHVVAFEDTGYSDKRSARGNCHISGHAADTTSCYTLNQNGVVDNYVNAVVLSGGSMFGLETMTGVRKYLYQKGVGLPYLSDTRPIVAGSIVSDDVALAFSGNQTLVDKFNAKEDAVATTPFWSDIGYEAVRKAYETPNQPEATAAGQFGGGQAAQIGFAWHGGVGQASVVDPDYGFTVGVIMLQNSAGSVNWARAVPEGEPANLADLTNGLPYFYAAPFEIGDEFGGLGHPPSGSSYMPAGLATPGFLNTRTPENLSPYEKGGVATPRQYTASCGVIVATDLCLTGENLARLTKYVAYGTASSTIPFAGYQDGDVEFIVSTCKYNGTVAEEKGYRAFPFGALGDGANLEYVIAGHIQAATARAVARGVWEGVFDIGSFLTFKSYFGCTQDAQGKWSCNDPSR